MCEFMSWISYENKIYFLQNADLETKEGKKLLMPEILADLCGHEAIRTFYPELKNKGTNEESTNFSTPDSFPPEIVDALKKGKLSRFGTDLVLLNNDGRETYGRVERQAKEAYERVERQAKEAYERVERQAKEAYKKVKQPAWEAYEKIEQPAWKAYKKIQQPAEEAYKKVKRQALWRIFKNKKYRNEKWL